MAQLIRLSRQCCHMSLYSKLNSNCRHILNIPKHTIHSSKCFQLPKKSSSIDMRKENEYDDDNKELMVERIHEACLKQGEANTELSSQQFKEQPRIAPEVIDLKAPTKTPPLSPEKDILLKENDPDTFGTLSRNVRTLIETNEMPEEEDDEVSTNFVNEKGQEREHNLEYAKKIVKLIEENKLPEALNVLDVEMKAVGARPANYIYTLLIVACGRVGHTQKAFKLYSDMRKRGLKVTAATYTGLLNACATCRNSQKGLEKVNFLRSKMSEKQYEMNEANYNALIKVFGRHGKPSAAFTIVDEMLEKRIRPSLTTFNFLLQACIGDREAGFRHALLTWHKMRSRRVSPDLFSYNLLLRATRDCGIGDEQTTALILNALISPENQPILEMKQSMQSSLHASTSSSSHSERIPSTPTTSHDSSFSSDATSYSEHGSSSVPEDRLMSFEESISEDLPEAVEEPSRVVENRPNMIAREPHLGSIISVGEVQKPEDRLVLLGGLSGVLSELAEDDIRPSVATFTLLLDCIPSCIESERQLLKAMEKSGVSPDTEFCNMLLKKRSFRGANAKAREVLDMFQEWRLEPDLITYGCLALTCENHQHAIRFLEEFNKSGYKLNKEILSALLQQACHRCDIHYAEAVLEMFIDYEVQPDTRVLKKLEEFAKKGLRIIAEKDKGEPLSGNLPGVVNAPWFPGEMFRFVRYHKKWLAQVEVEKQVPLESQFRAAQKEAQLKTQESDAIPNRERSYAAQKHVRSENKVGTIPRRERSYGAQKHARFENKR